MTEIFFKSILQIINVVNVH